MTGRPTRAARAATQLLKEHGVDGVPVPVEKIAKDLGCSLSYEPLDGDVSGLLFRDEDQTQKVIGVNSRESTQRQRFTIAHEIGHLQLHEGRPLIIEKLVLVNTRAAKALATPSEEREANQFAAELLMPAAMVRQRAKVLVGGEPRIADGSLIRELARQFDVSTQAMGYRLVNLELISPMSMEG